MLAKIVRTISRIFWFVAFAAEKKEFVRRPCPICGSQDEGAVVSEDREGIGLSYISCESCGAIFASNFFSENYLGWFYGYWYQKLYGRGAKGSNRKYNASKAEKVFDALPRDAQEMLSSFRICDYGCGDGGVLAALPTASQKVGFEYSSDALPQIAGNGIEACLLSEKLKFQERFDLVISLQVIEHTLYPAEYIRELTALARTGGYIFVEFPLLPSELGLPHFKIPHCNMLTSSDVVKSIADDGDLRPVHSGGDFVLFRKSAGNIVSIKSETLRVNYDNSDLPFKWRLIRFFVKSTLRFRRNT